MYSVIQPAQMIRPDMLVQLPAPGQEDTNNKNLFEKNMSKLPLCISVLILVNLACYGVEIATGALLSRAAIVDAGALQRGPVLQGEVWRLLSAAFLHGSVGHLAGNLIFLYILGLAAEHAWGTVRTAGLYFVAALTGSLFSIAMQPGPGVGASGAVFGIMGALVVYFRKNSQNFTLRDGNIGLLIAIIAVIQIVQGFTNPYIDNYAHIGGFLGGAAAAFGMRNQLAKQTVRHWTSEKRIKALLLGVLIFDGILFFLYKGYFYSIMGTTAVQLGQMPAAVRYSTRALDLNPANVRPLISRSMAYNRMGRSDLALQDLAAFVAALPMEKSGYQLLADFHSSRGEYAAAIAGYSQAIKIEPQAGLYNGRGYSRLLYGRYREARTDFMAALGIDGHYAAAYGNLGLTDAMEGNYAAAVTQMEKGLKMDKSQEPLTSLIGALKNEQAGNSVEAIKAYDAFLRRIGNNKNWEAEHLFASARRTKLSGK